MPSAVYPGKQGLGSEPAHESTCQPDSIPPHPLGVKPLGNKYLSEKRNARGCIGTWLALPDEVLMVILEYLSPSSLLHLGHTCKYLYAFCCSDELWKPLFLDNLAKKPEPVQWSGSWRSTVLALPDDTEIHVDCGNVFSDVLHRPFACSKVNLDQFTTRIPRSNHIQRFDNLPYEEFSDKWTRQPFILSKCIQEWPVTSKWTVDELLREYGEVEFRAEAVDWTFSTYCKYMRKNRDESPLYLFDRKFAEKMSLTVGHEQGASYWRPDCFGPDFFEVLGEERPAHRWLIIGPERSGSTFHKDPNGTSAWNAVIQGAKYWIMFPPTAQVPGVYVSQDSSEVTSPLSIAEWLLTFHEEARELPECIEGICHAGEILHVPSGWWHLVVNLEDGVALTQNFVPKSSSLYHLSEVLSFLRDKPDQVSGFKRNVEDPYKLFTERLEKEYPEALEKALDILDARNGKKRKWEAAVVQVEEQSGGGFSFGFGGDDLDDEEIP